jgi:diguanylate cyclase (GGDEF)-like protein
MNLIVVYLGVLGYRQRVRLPLYTARFVGGILFTEAFMGWFQFVHPDPGLWLAAIPLYSAVMLLLSARAVVHGRRRANTSERCSAIVQCTFACVEVVLTVFAVQIGRIPHPAAVLHYNQVIVIGVPACYLANGLIAVLIIASDLAGKMEVLAETDTLTGLVNRRGCEREAADAIRRAHARNKPLAVILADIDHFKRINDRHGHGVGDVALARFSSHLRATLPDARLLGRLGGEEFVVLLSETSEQEAIEAAERLREGVPGISLAEFEAEPFTASFGVTLLKPTDSNLADILARADIALYQAKATGRNRVCLFDPEHRPLHVARRDRPMLA